MTNIQIEVFCTREIQRFIEGGILLARNEDVPVILMVINKVV